MAEPHVVFALRVKRAEIASHIHDLEKKFARSRASLASIDATIRVFSPELDPDAIPPKRTYRRTRYSSKGELSRRILALLPREHVEIHTLGNLSLGLAPILWPRIVLRLHVDARRHAVGFTPLR